MEAIIAIEIGVPTLQTEVPEEENTEAITKDLDMIDELHEVMAVLITSYQQRMKNLYNKRVKQLVFRAGDLVLRRVFENTTDPTSGKFQSNWEGPYVVVRVGAVRSYALNKLDGMLVPKMWNAMHLKRYYP